MKIGVKLMYGFLRLVSALPLGFHYACASFISWVLRDLLRYRRDVVMTNLARSFPDKNYGDLKQIARRFYRHFGTIIAETVWFGSCTKEERFRKQRLFELANPEVLAEAFRNSPGDDPDPAATELWRRAAVPDRGCMPAQICSAAGLE